MGQSDKTADKPYQKFLYLWDNISKQIRESPSGQEYIKQAEEFERLILEAMHESVVKQCHPLVANEFSRILSITIRRFHGVIACAKLALTDLVTDELRALIELMFQCFYLLRHTDPVQAALDAINLSAVSWAKKGDYLRETGQIEQWKFDDDSQRLAMEAVRQNVFPKYNGRKPRFYADLSVKEIAEGAKLERVYDLVYGAFSAHLHSEPISQLKSFRPIEDRNGIALTVYPDQRALSRLLPELSLSTQIFVLTSLGCLCGFVDIDTDRRNAVIHRFNIVYEGYGWDEEIKTIRLGWGEKE